MKRSFILAILLGIAIVPIMAQNENLSIAVALPKQQMTEKEDVLQLLKSRLSSAMTESGIGMADYSGIIVSPQTIVTNKKIVEGGMKNIHIYDIELSLVISHVITGTVFSSVNLTLRGEGHTKDNAIMASISNLSSKNKHLAVFFSETRIKILDYYRNNTQAIITKALTMAGMQQYEGAVALLSSYPETLSQYRLVAAAMKDVYVMYQQKKCSDILQKAQGAFALGNYEESVRWFNEIDMSSSCAKEAKGLAGQIKQSVDAELARNIALYEKQMQVEENIEKRRVQVIENIAVAYYKNQPKYYFVF
ncbi:MAG: hypothetical protein LUD46_15665 [Parabacteroides sp.]|nr:hypothetical protein [Parabacteroides sp.]